MNGLLLLACLSLALNKPSDTLVAAWLSVSALLASNAVWHIVGALRTRRYSPGVVTGTLLYIPMALHGFAHFTGSRQASVPTALVVAALIGGSYHWWAR